MKVNTEGARVWRIYISGNVDHNSNEIVIPIPREVVARDKESVGKVSCPSRIRKGFFSLWILYA